MLLRGMYVALGGNVYRFRGECMLLEGGKYVA